MIYRIAITTGDSDGIGAEVASKALNRLGPQKNVQFILYYQKTSQLKYFSGLKKKFSSQQLVLKHDRRSPALWVEDILLQQSSGQISGLVTGPLSKPEIILTGLQDLGHTDIIKRVTKSKTAYMAFVGKRFNVSLVTGHIPLREVAGNISVEKIVECCELTHELVQKISPQKRKLPIALVGLNPHAGDSGLIGNEETLVKKAAQLLNKRGIKTAGPLVPDVCFMPNEWKKYCFYIALYHDQGLIPFKMIHERSGSHLTLGVPIIRTSVDHGTARDIYGMNKADSQSMLDSIRLCIKLVRSHNV